jgi:hypothetical protein
MSKTVTSLIATALLALAISGTAAAATGACLRVIVVKADNVTTYLHELDKARDMAKRLGLSIQIHAYRATYAGAATGELVVTIEYPSFQAMADAVAKQESDKEFSAWLKGLDKVRTITSDSLYREL